MFDINSNQDKTSKLSFKDTPDLQSMAEMSHPTAADQQV
jgi:hypothetical protein